MGSERASASPAERSDTEDALWQLLELRRWSVDLESAERKAEVVRFDVAFEGQPGQAHLVFASEDRTDVPAFVRIDLGTRSAIADRWTMDEARGALIDPDNSDSQARHQVAYQSAWGPGWVAVGAGIHPAPGARAWPAVLENLATRAERSSPSRSDRERDKAFQDTASRTSRAERRGTWLRWGARAFMAALAVGTATTLVSGLWLANEGFLLISGVGAVLIVPFAIASDLRPPRNVRSLAWQGPLPILDQAGLFDLVRRGRAEQVVSLHAVRRGPDGTALRQVPLERERVTIAARGHPLSGKLALYRIAWPSGTLPVCRLIPSEYAVILLEGPDEVLDTLPSHPRTTRSSAGLTWTMQGDEIASGQAEHLARDIAQALGVLGEAHPYRDKP